MNNTELYKNGGQESSQLSRKSRQTLLQYRLVSKRIEGLPIYLCNCIFSWDRPATTCPMGENCLANF